MSVKEWEWAHEEINSKNEGAVEVGRGSGINLNIVYGKGRACESTERAGHSPRMVSYMYVFHIANLTLIAML